MSTKTKIITALVIACIVGLLLFWIQKQNTELAKLKAQNSSLVQQKSLQDGTVRSMSSYASKSDIERLIKESGLDLNVIEKDLKTLGSDLKGIQVVIASSKGFKGTNIGSSTVVPGKNDDGTVVAVPIVECKSGEKITCPDEFGYLTNRQVYVLQEPFGENNVPIGSVGFQAWKPKPWDAEIYPREYQVSTVVSIDENGKSNYHNKITITSNKKTTTIPIQNSQFVETYPSSKFRFNPRLYFGLDAGLMAANFGGQVPDEFGEVTPNLQLALFSIGKTKIDTTWTFIGIGAGFETQNTSVALMLSPVNYNIGKPIPLIENLFLGPTLSLDPKGNFGVLLGLRVGL